MKKRFLKTLVLCLGLTGATSSICAAGYMDTAVISLNLRNVTMEQVFKKLF